MKILKKLLKIAPSEFILVNTLSDGSGLKAQQESDKWQLVRDLTKEEMEEIKNTGEYEFSKKLQMEFTVAFIKIIKIMQIGK